MISSTRIDLPSPNHLNWYTVQEWSTYLGTSDKATIYIIGALVSIFAIFIIFWAALRLPKLAVALAGILVLVILVTVYAADNSKNHVTKVDPDFNATAYPSESDANAAAKRLNNSKLYEGSTFKVLQSENIPKGAKMCMTTKQCPDDKTFVLKDNFETNNLVINRINSTLESTYGAKSLDHAPMKIVPDENWSMKDLTNARSYTLHDGSHHRCLVTYANQRTAPVYGTFSDIMVTSFDIKQFICENGSSNPTIVKPIK